MTGHTSEMPEFSGPEPEEDEDYGPPRMPPGDDPRSGDLMKPGKHRSTSPIPMGEVHAEVKMFAIGLVIGILFMALIWGVWLLLA